MREKSHLKKQILDEAARLFVERGYHAVSMREISETLNVSKAALYYHFKDKESLLMAILTGYLDEIGTLLDANCPPTQNTRTRITNLINAIFSQPPQKRAITRLATQEIRQLDITKQVSFHQIYHDKFIGKIEKIFQDGIGRSEIKPLDAQAAAWILLGLMYPFFYANPARDVQPGDPVIGLMIDIFLNGIAL